VSYLIREGRQNARSPKPLSGTVLFPVSVLVIYGILFSVFPDKAWLALRGSVAVFLRLLLPLGLVFAAMLVFNLLLKPAQIIRFLGKNAGIKGIILSMAGGIISAGPIYAWYPLLAEVRKKGAGNIPIAVFLYNRAVKPFLLPVMIAYFGWAYVGTLTFLTMLASVGIGYCLSLLIKENSYR
jgi:uncharacterized membrane protein YraQ (UPF0718 family)